MEGSALLSPIPASLTHNRHHALRLLPIPIFLLVLAIPGLERLFRVVRTRWDARFAAAALGLAVVLQFLWALHWYDFQGPRRRIFFEADVPGLLQPTLASGGTIYVEVQSIAEEVLMVRRIDAGRHEVAK